MLGCVCTFTMNDWYLESCMKLGIEHLALSDGAIYFAVNCLMVIFLRDRMNPNFQITS